MKKIVFLWLLAPLFCFGQKVELPVVFVRSSLLNKDVPSVQYKGSPYLNKEFVLGKIIVDNSKSFEMKLRYNAYADVFELQNNNQINTLIKSSNTKVFLEKKLFEIYEYLDKSSKKEGYFENLNINDEVILLKRSRKKFTDVVKSQSGYAEDKPAKFTLEIVYYIKRDKFLPAIEIKLNKKSILKALNDKEKSLKNYIKKHKLKLKKERDVVQLFEYYNKHIE